MFVVLVFSFFISGRYCEQYRARKRDHLKAIEPQTEILDADQKQALILEETNKFIENDQDPWGSFCEKSDVFTLNFGVLFLILVVVRTVMGKMNKKAKKE